MRWEALTSEKQALVTRWREANSARRVWEKNEKSLARQVQHLLREVPGIAGPGWRGDFAATEPRADVDWHAVALALSEGVAVKKWSELVDSNTKMVSTRPLVGREEKKR